MMIDVDPDFRGRDGGERGAQPALNCGVERDGNVYVLCCCRWFRQQFSERKERIFLEHSVLVPDAYAFAKLPEREAERELAAKRIAIGANMTEHNELLMFAKDAANLFERCVTHSSWPSGLPRSSKISSTRAPRLMDSSRWKMRCGVYFNTTCRDSVACNAGRCASSLSITLLPLSAPRVLTKTFAL